MNNRYYVLQQMGSKAELYIFGDITSWPWKEGDVSAYGIVQEIKELDVEEIDVCINSCGGEVAEGWAIYNALKQHKAKVNTYGMGFVASAALYPFMAGDNRYAAATSAYYFHQMMAGGYGYAGDLRKLADEIEKLDEIGRKVFTENAEISAEDIAALESQETWLSAQEVFELGIATALISERQATAATQSVRRDILQRVMRKPEQKAEPTQAPTQEPEAKPGEQTLAGFFGIQERG